MMDRRTLEEHLEAAERRIAQGQQHLSSQRAIVAELRADGHDSREAEELLAILEQSQALHIAGRDRIRNELGPAATGEV
jgi:hypothetical protein